MRQVSTYSMRCCMQEVLENVAARVIMNMGGKTYYVLYKMR